MTLMTLDVFIVAEHEAEGSQDTFCAELWGKVMPSHQGLLLLCCRFWQLECLPQIYGSSLQRCQRAALR